MKNLTDNTAVEVSNLWKTYQIWKDPKARLKSPLIELSGNLLTRSRISSLRNLGGLLQSRSRKYCKHFDALRNVSFSLKKGEALGIVGLNGSGKSTLLQILAGVLKPTKGTYRTSGRVVALLELGSGFNGEFTGRENVYLNGAILGVPKEEMRKRFQQIEDFAEIGDFIDQPVKTYSSGMTVRLAFSVLTQVNPEILIIDEALSVGDAYFQHKSAQVIRKFRDEGKTLLFVAHNPEAVKSLCNRAILLEKGVVIQEGPAESVLDYYNAVVSKKEKDLEIRQIEVETGRTITRSGNKLAEIEAIELYDENGDPSRAFQTGTEAEIRATIRFNSDMINPTFGILIRNRLGMDVFGTNTFYNNPLSNHHEAGSASDAHARFRLNLGQGSYSITVAIHSGSVHTDENYDWIDHAIVFDVLPQAGKHFVGTAALPCKIAWS